MNNRYILYFQMCTCYHNSNIITFKMIFHYILFELIILFYFVCICVNLPVCICAMYVPCICGCQNRIPDLLKLKSLMIVNQYHYHITSLFGCWEPSLGPLQLYQMFFFFNLNILNRHKTQTHSPTPPAPLPR